MDGAEMAKARAGLKARGVALKGRGEGERRAMERELKLPL